MTWFSWLTRNWADTNDPSDPSLPPLVLTRQVPEVLELVETVISHLPRWRVEQVDTSAGLVRATRRTRWWRFVDDITIRLEAFPGGTRVHARSESRIGRGDLGQNRRNLIELYAALRNS
jgi:uncharacterized protein (DUF1499 family)